MTIIVEENERTRVIYDDLNPRIYEQQICCCGCNGWIEGEDDRVFIDPKTGEATDHGDPYHLDCAPDEEDGDTDI